MNIASAKRAIHCTPALLVVLAVAVLATGCGAVAAQSAAPTVNATSAGAKTGGSAYKQTSEGGSVTLVVTWENPTAGAGQPLRFGVAMDTHSVDLDGYDLGKLAVLRSDQGLEAMPSEWNAPKGGHHREGKLVFSSSEGGKPLLRPGTKSIELVIQDVAGVKERSFRWEVPQ